MLEQNIVPSLRQSMINEALDYHQNMNSVVFKRQARNLETYARESGKVDPSPKDILVEGSIRQKVGEISNQIQRLNQQLNYASSGVIAPAVVGSGIGGRRGKQSKIRRNVNRDRLERGEVPIDFSTLNPRSDEGYRRESRDAIEAARSYQPIEPQEQEFYERGQEPEFGRTFQPMQPSLGLPQTFDVNERLRLHNPPPPPPSSSSSGTSSVMSIGRQQEYNRGYQKQEEERKQQERDLDRALRATFPSEPSEPSESEPIAPGPIFSSSPSASESSKLYLIVDNSLASIVGLYNSLIDYIEMQQKQRAFSQQDEQLVSQLLRELIDPMKMLIANSAVAKQGATKDLVDYTRIYNVISTLISRISSSPPFLKVPTGLLTEKLPIREDIIQAANFNPDKEANHQYLGQLIKKIEHERDLLVRTFPKSPLEKEARELKLKELETVYRKITSAGYRPSSEIMKDIARVEAIEANQPELGKQIQSKAARLIDLDTRLNLDPREELSKIQEETLLIERLQENLADSTQEIAGMMEEISRLDSIFARHAEDIRIHGETPEVLTAMSDIVRAVRDIEEQSAVLKQESFDIERDLKDFDKTVRERNKRLETLQYQDPQNLKVIYDREKHELNLLDQEYQKNKAMLEKFRQMSPEVLKYHKKNAPKEAHLTRNRATENKGLKRDISFLKPHVEEKVPAMFPRDKPIPKQGETLEENFNFYKRGMLPNSEDYIVKLLLNPIKDDDSNNAIHRKYSKAELRQFFKTKIGSQNLYRLEQSGMSPSDVEDYKREMQAALDSVPTGRGKPTSLRGGHVHKKSDDLFGDNSELAPYLTKYLRPSKHRQNVPPIESSSDESSDSEEGEPYRVMKGFGDGMRSLPSTSGKKNRKKIEDYEIIETQLHPDKAVLIEKKTRTKRIAGGKVIKSVKAVHETAPSQDLWFI